MSTQAVGWRIWRKLYQRPLDLVTVSLLFSSSRRKKRESLPLTSNIDHRRLTDIYVTGIYGVGGAFSRRHQKLGKLRTLQELCIQSALLNLDKMNAEALGALPQSLAKALWNELVRL